MTDDSPKVLTPDEELLEEAWGIIANARDWLIEDDQSLNWEAAAKRWRDKYFSRYLTGNEPKAIARKNHAEQAKMLGKRVRVWIDRKAHYPAIPDCGDIPGRGAIDTVDVIVEGIFLGYGDGGEFEIMEDDCFVYHCWPLLEIKLVEEVKVNVNETS